MLIITGAISSYFKVPLPLLAGGFGGPRFKGSAGRAHTYLPSADVYASL